MQLSKGLLRVLPSPGVPVGNHGDWSEVERDIGTPLPADYKAFVETYGDGQIDEFFYVLLPFPPWQTLARRGREIAAVYADFDDDDIPAFFPEPGGLLLAATTDNGNFICWRTVGPPDGWSIVILEGRGPDVVEFDGTLTEFLEAVLERRFRCAIFPEDFPSARPRFRRSADARVRVTIAFGFTEEAPFEARVAKLFTRLAATALTVHSDSAASFQLRDETDRLDVHYNEGPHSFIDITFAEADEEIARETMKTALGVIDGNALWCRDVHGKHIWHDLQSATHQ